MQSFLCSIGHMKAILWIVITKMIILKAVSWGFQDLEQKYKWWPTHYISNI